MKTAQHIQTATRMDATSLMLSEKAHEEKIYTVLF